MKRHHIVLASILKPVDDPRMYEKIGRSLAKHYTVHIIGAPTQQKIQDVPFLNFHPLKTENGKPNRRRAIATFAQHLLKLQPKLIVVHTPELLPIAILYRLLCFFRGRDSKIIYDLRENYWRNILHQGYYRGLKKWVLALGVSSVERIAYPFLHQVFLAEKCYQTEKSYVNRKAIVLENKYQPLKEHNAKRHTTELLLKKPIKALCVGTLSEIFGIEQAIRWVINLREEGLEIELRLVGHVATHAMRKSIERSVTEYSYIHCAGSTTPVTHSKIIEAMLASDVVLLPYIPNPSTAHCIPTKMYECLALHIPMVIQTNKTWEKLCTPHQAALFTDFATKPAQTFTQQLLHFTFHPNTESKPNAFWSSEEPRLLEAVKYHIL